MAFYLKLPERYNTQGCPALETPAPGVAVSSCCPPRCAALCPINYELCPLSPALPMFCPLAML